MIGLKPVLFPLTCLVVVGALVYTEEITSERPPPGPIHITYWEKWTGFEFDSMKAVVNDYNNSQSRVHVDVLSITDIGAKTLMAVSANVPPDVAGLFGGNVAQYADDHAIEPLDDYCREAGISAKDYVPAYYEMGHYDGHIWALPSTPATIVLHYNKVLLDKAGYSKAPETIEDLDAMADKMTEKEGGKVLVAGFLPSEPDWWTWAWPNYFGGSIVTESGKITATEPECLRSLDWAQSFTKKMGVSPFLSFRSSFGNFSSAQNPFLAGHIGMEVQGVWMANFIHQYAPELNWSAAPFPHPADRPDLANTSLVDMDILAIPRGAKHPKEAFEFIKFVQSQKEMEKLCLGQWKTTPLSHVSEEFWANHKNPCIRLFYDMANSKNAFSIPKIGIWPELSAQFATEYDSISLMNKTPKQAMADFKERMQPKLEQYKQRHDRRIKLGL